MPRCADAMMARCHDARTIFPAKPTPCPMMYDANLLTMLRWTVDEARLWPPVVLLRPTLPSSNNVLPLLAELIANLLLRHMRVAGAVAVAAAPGRLRSAAVVENASPGSL